MTSVHATLAMKFVLLTLARCCKPIIPSEYWRLELHEEVNWAIIDDDTTPRTRT